MKNYFFIILVIFLISCEKDDVEPEFGFLGNYLKNNPEISILKTSESDVVYARDAATYRGYVFRPLVDLKLNSFGGRIAEHGVYKFEIFKLDKWSVSPIDTLLMASIKISNINSFQYKNINKEILLLANERYLIRYFNVNHNSVYDAGLGIWQSDIMNEIRFPLIIDDIEIEIPYYTYHAKHNDKYWLFQEGTFNYGILRGLIDFKYELAK